MFERGAWTLSLSFRPSDPLARPSFWETSTSSRSNGRTKGSNLFRLWCCECPLRILSALAKRPNRTWADSLFLITKMIKMVRARRVNPPTMVPAMSGIEIRLGSGDDGSKLPIFRRKLLLQIIRNTQVLERSYHTLTYFNASGAYMPPIAGLLYRNSLAPDI